MNKILNLGVTSVKINNNENYDFSVLGKKVLCLNKRLVELGVGACALASFWSHLGQSIEGSLANRIFEFIGFSSFVSLTGLKGTGYLLLFCSLHQAIGVAITRPEFTLWPTINNIGALSHIIGYNLTLLSSFYVLFVGLAFLIKRYGNQCINELLRNLNKSQNVFNMGIMEVKDNLKFHFYVLGKDVLCLKKIVLQLGLVLSYVVAYLFEFYREGRINGLLAIVSMMVGLFTTHKVLADKIYILPALVGFFTLLNPDNYSWYWAMTEQQILLMGEGMVFMGSAFILLTYLFKQSQNQQIKKLLKSFESLKDKRKVRDHEQCIRDQRLLLEKRNEYRKQSISGYGVDSNWDLGSVGAVKNRKKRDSNEKSEDKDVSTKGLSGKANRLKVQAGDQNKKNEKYGQKANLSDVKREYEVNLGKRNWITWSILFDGNKSKPDHLAIQGTEVEKLIKALRGEVKQGKKRYHIHFNGKNLGYYEVTHGNDKPGYLTDDYALNVKQAIEKAIESKYINEAFIKLKR